jgi:ADP-heptose:LPS heptosyltransferase
MPRRIAIVRLSAIGDVVHGLPLARSVRQVFPGSLVSWIVQEGPAPLLEHHPWVDRRLIFPRHSGAAEAAKFLKGLAAEQFDLAIDVQGNFKSGMVLRATAAPRRVGLARRDYREPLGAIAATEHAAPGAGPHSVDRTLALCRHLGDPDPVAGYGLEPTAAELDRARADLSDLGPRTVAFSVGSETDVREWPDDSYVTAAMTLAGEGIDVIVFSGPAHAERGRAIARAAGVPERCGVTDLRGLLAHLAALAERPAAVLVACDSAPLHIAVAVGLPVLALSGPQDPARTGPYGQPGRAITAWENLECAPCRKRRCRLDDEPKACMERLDPAHVVSRLRRVVS